jgi:hypothetical protein
MKNANPSAEFKRLLRFFLRAARFGLTAGFSLVVAELASWLTSARYARLAEKPLGLFVMLESEDEVIRKTNDNHVAARLLPAHRTTRAP